MKKVISLLMSFVMLMSVACGTAITAKANIYSGGNSNCTAYVWQKTYDTLKISLPNWGMAQDWYNTAKSQGYPVSDTPKANWIVCYGPSANGSSPGHVAYVESVSGTKMTFSEGGYNGGYHKDTMTWVKKGERTDCNYGSNWKRTCYGYINPNKNETVTVKFDANGGTVRGSSSLTLNKGGSVGTNIPSAVKGYSAFEGWYTAKSGGTKVQTSTTFSANTTLYAHWTNVSRYGLPFDTSKVRTVGIYRIKNVKSGKYVSSNGMGNKAVIVQKNFDEYNRRQWWYVYACEDSTGVYYRFKNCYAYNNRYLDMTGASNTLATQLQIYDDSTSNNQKWQIISRGSGKYSVHSVSTGRVMDIKGGSSDDGIAVQSYYYNNSDAQMFLFEEITKRNVSYYDNLSNNYIKSVDDISSRNEDAVKVTADSENQTVVLNALKAGKCGEDMQFKTTVNGSSTCDTTLEEASEKYITFMAKSSVEGAKIMFRWGYDSTTEPCNSIALSTDWLSYTVKLPRTIDSGSNIHPWIDQACTIEMKDIALVDEEGLSNHSVYPNENKQVITYDVSQSEELDTAGVMPTEQKSDCHFVGWYTKRSGGNKVSSDNKLNIAKGITNLYAHWEKHNWVDEKIVAPTVTEEGYTIQKCSCGAERKVNIVEPSGHDCVYEWQYNNDAEYVSSSNYKDGTATGVCSICGKSETKIINGTGILRANTASVILDASVTLNIGIDKSRTSPFESSFIRIEFGGESYDLTEPSAKTTTDRTYYDFDKISPDKFADEVTITPYGVTSDGIVCKGHPVTYSIKNYCYTQLNKTPSQNLKALLVELLYYGEEYQKYRGYNTDNLVTSDLTDEQKKLHTTNTLDYSNVTNSKYRLNPNGTDKNEVAFKSASMLLEGKVIPRIKVEISSEESISDYTFRWTVDGQNTEFTYAEHPDWFTQTNGSASDKRAYYVDCTILKANQFSTPFYLTVFKDGTQVSNMLQYSVESYATGSTVKNNVKLKSLVDQMLRYGRAEKIRLEQSV